MSQLGVLPRSQPMSYIPPTSTSGYSIAPPSQYPLQPLPSTSSLASQYPMNAPQHSRVPSIPSNEQAMASSTKGEATENEDRKPDVEPKRASKRGRKKKADESVSKETDPDKKRKIQNRHSQRLFRERKEQHLRDLEVKVVLQEQKLDQFQILVQKLIADNEALRRGERVATREYEIPSPIPVSENHPSPSPSSANSLHQTQKAPTNKIKSEAETNSVVPATYSMETSLSPIIPAANSVYAFSAPPTTSLAPPELPPRTTSATLDDLARMAGLANPYSNSAAPPNGSMQDLDMKNLDLAFDFDAPFDYNTENLPLSELFQTYFDSNAFPQEFDAQQNQPAAAPAAAPVVAQIKQEEIDEEEDEMADPPALPNGRIPCDKPECDFSLVSCQLPAPWRPKTISADAETEVWDCKQSWAKLCSHKLLNQVDVNELCHELRDKTRCSHDGRLVIPKSDVVAIYRSIPARARARK